MCQVKVRIVEPPNPLELFTELEYNETRRKIDQEGGDGLQSVIQIAIMDYTLFPEHRRFFTKYVLQDDEVYRFSDKLQFYVMDLTAKEDAEEDEKANGLVDWAEAFTAKSWEKVGQIDNPSVKEAQKTMEVIMSEPTQRQLIIDRKTALLDRQAELDDAKRKGQQEAYERMVASGMLESQARAFAFG